MRRLLTSYDAVLQYGLSELQLRFRIRLSVFLYQKYLK